MWDFGANILPENNTLNNFGDLEKMLKTHRRETTKKVHCCRNMCVGFFNPTSPRFAHRLDLMNEHRTQCPVCGQARYVHGTKKPVRWFWYLPVKCWLQDLFAKGDMVRHMANDLDPAKYPDGHVRRYQRERATVASCTLLQGHLHIYSPTIATPLTHTQVGRVAAESDGE